LFSAEPGGRGRSRDASGSPARWSAETLSQPAARWLASIDLKPARFSALPEYARLAPYAFEKELPGLYRGLETGRDADRLRRAEEKPHNAGF